jgi:hypothetical protein
VVHLHNTALALRTVVRARRLFRVTQFSLAVGEVLHIDQILLLRSQVNIYSLGCPSGADAYLRYSLFSASSF